MKASEKLKYRIYSQIDNLDESILEELYGIMTNYINGKRDINEWESLTYAQQKGIMKAINEIKSGKGIHQKMVVSDIRRKYSND